MIWVVLIQFAINFDPYVEVDDQLMYLSYLWMYGFSINALNFDPTANINQIDVDYSEPCIEIVEGCTDISSINFNSSSNFDDGSCIAYESCIL